MPPDVLDGRFDDDYLYFFGHEFTPERNDRQSRLVADLLDLQPGARLLDAPCGYGRIANRLATRCLVTGIDANHDYVELARKEADALAVPVVYLAGDMRALPFDDRFDHVVCWFTSFGYYDDATDFRLLQEFRRVLRDGGTLLLQLANLSCQLMLFEAPHGPQTTVYERDGNCMVNRSTYNPETGRADVVRHTMRDGRYSRCDFSVRVFSFPEIREWLLRAGFSQVRVRGADGGPLTNGSPKMHVIATA
jgi:SAM-dependent methyltransferase